MRIIALQDNYPPKDKWLRVEWNIGRRCNHSCSYCDPGLHDFNSEDINMDITFKTIDKLANAALREQKECRLSFTGGEPFLHKDFIKILNHANKNSIQRLSVTTNGSLPFKIYEEALRYLSYIIFSYHFEYSHRYNFIEKMIRINKMLQVYNQVRGNVSKKIHVHIMMLPGKFREARGLAKVLGGNNIPYVYRRIRPPPRDIGDTEYYSKKELEFFKKQKGRAANFKNIEVFYGDNQVATHKEELNINDLLMQKTNKFKDWKCWAGVQGITINVKGEVWRGICRQGGKLGSIYSDFKIPNKPVICRKNNCNCAAEIQYSKALPEYKYLLRICNNG